MIQNIDKITTNEGSVILWNNNSIIVSIPKGMFYCHIIDGIVKIKQIAVENIFNIVKTSPIDGETFPLVEDMLKKLSSFSRGGGTGAGGVTWDSIVGKPAVIASGTTQATARQSIGAGTSNLTIGTTASTAKAGNYVPMWGEVTGKPVLFSGDYNDLINKPTYIESVENQNTTQPNIKFWTGTQAAYDSITLPNPNTLYFIKP